MTRPGPLVVALPEPADLAEYDAAAAEIEAALRDVPGMVAVYSLGEVAAPGISDLDRVAVVSDATGVAPVWDRVSPRTRALAMHPPFLVDEEAFRQHKWFAHLEPLELLWGTGLAVESPPEPEHSERLLAAESLLVNLLRAVKQAHVGMIKARPAMCELNNLRHALRLGRLDPPAARAAWELTDRVTALRATWFGLDADEREVQLVGLVAAAPSAISQALAALEAVAPEPALRELRLGAPWSNVVLTPERQTDRAPGMRPRRVWRAMGTAKARRASEMLWSLRTRRVAVPAATLGLVAGDVAQHRDFHLRRRQIVAAYLDFMGRHGNGYAAIGMAAPFAAR